MSGLVRELGKNMKILFLIIIIMIIVIVIIVTFIIKLNNICDKYT